MQRTKLRDAFISAVASRLEAGRATPTAMLLRIAARRLIEVDPYNETGHRALMRLFAEEGEPARVRDIYRNLQQRLRDDLGVEPDGATASALPFARCRARCDERARRAVRAVTARQRAASLAGMRRADAGKLVRRREACSPHRSGVPQA